MRTALNIKRPYEMEQYLSYNGWHFNKKSLAYAASMMYKTDEKGRREYIDPIKMEDLRQLMTMYGLDINEEDMYDAAYVANMCRADLMGGKDAAIEDDAHLARYVYRTVNDPDAGDGAIMMAWHAKMCAAGIGVDWSELV